MNPFIEGAMDAIRMVNDLNAKLVIANRIIAEQDETITKLCVTMQAISNTVAHEKDGQDCTAETMRKFARYALAEATK